MNRINISRTHSKGFTLVELMLAMAFFGSVLLISTSVFLQMLGTYNKGIAVKDMNQFGRMLSDSITRVSNSQGGLTYFGDASQPWFLTYPLRCAKVGRDMYLWSYASDTSSTAAAYKVGGEPVNMVRLVTTPFFGNCPQQNDTYTDQGGNVKNFVANDNFVPILDNNTRVYASDIHKLHQTDQTTGTVTEVPDALFLKFTLGTYGGAGSVNNPTIDGSGNASCPADSIGNFCAFGSYQTVIYLPNGI
jgi:prepilin-type N-terminal cleavage/methylation domain-containing protein